jgi:hypothetical protein
MWTLFLLVLGFCSFATLHTCWHYVITSYLYHCVKPKEPKPCWSPNATDLSEWLMILAKSKYCLYSFGSPWNIMETFGTLAASTGLHFWGLLDELSPCCQLPCILGFIPSIYDTFCWCKDPSHAWLICFIDLTCSVYRQASPWYMLVHASL